MRVPADEPLGRPQTRPTECAGDETCLVAGDPVDADALGHRFVHRVTRVERAGRILEDHLHLAAQTAHRPVAVGDGLSLERDRSRR